jgi:hypothetical protein
VRPLQDNLFGFALAGRGDEVPRKADLMLGSLT